VKKLVSREVADTQLGAWLMAVYLKGFSGEEASNLTRSMVTCGAQLTWPDHWDKKLIVDKHSTGGVGDKVSLPLAPALAACGLKVPMVSGRGLGITGGTLDKLESIPNFRVQLSEKEITAALEEIGCCIVGQTEQICPADRIMYSARDVTGTVGSRGLITSSIISKKVAEGISSLVLDVKWGLGCYQQTLKEGEDLAEALVEAARSLGVSTTAVITNMDSPVGQAIGNSLEVYESLDCLRGGGPADLRELVCVEGGLLLLSAGLVNSREEGAERIGKVLDNGSALKKFADMLKFQGAGEDVVADLISNKSSVLTSAKHITKLESQVSGYVAQIHAGHIARLAGSLGAGRSKPGDLVDHAVGIRLNKSTGDTVELGEVWGEIHHNQPLSPQTIDETRDWITVADSPQHIQNRISKIIT